MNRVETEQILQEYDPYGGPPEWVGTLLLCIVFPPFILAVLGEKLWRRVILPRL